MRLDGDGEKKRYDGVRGMDDKEQRDACTSVSSWKELERDKNMNPLSNSDGLVLKCYLWVTSLVLHLVMSGPGYISLSLFFPLCNPHAPLIFLFVSVLIVDELQSYN